jgi:membrane protease YdiL (CAAX protease family)
MLNCFKKNPILFGFCILIISFILRLNDIFVLKIDQLLGEIVVSKALGFILILVSMYLIKKSLSTIGLHKKHLVLCISLGFLLNLAVYLISYGIEYFILLQGGQSPHMELLAIDPKQGVNGGIIFGIWLVIGNIINALMEEGLFRGVFLPAFKTRFSFWKANTFQALLFGMWHLVWPLKNYLTGEQSLMGAVMYGLILMLGTVTFGFIWGYMFEKTNSLWTPIAAHFAANTIQNLLHVQSNGGLDVMVSLRGTLASLLGIASIFFIKWITGKYKLSALKSWEQAV